ncbi:hypothetical protein BH10ACT1_BH10ACT1_42980 [soil metagenome]
MADDDVLPAAALPVTTVQAWRAHVGQGPGGGEPAGEVLGDVVVLELGVEGATLPPLLVPLGSVAGLAAVLLQAAGIDVGSTGPGAAPARPGGSDGGPDPELDADPIAALPDGSPWAALVAAERVRADELSRSTLPSGPGAYVWFRQGIPIHLGRAVGKRGLRARIGGDALQGDADLSRSPFRAAVADHLGFGLDDEGGLAHLDPKEVARLDAWIAGCRVAWLRAATPAQATHLEATLRTDHDPALDSLD